MRPCDCDLQHAHHRRVVLTGGPGAGKTAVLELVRLLFCVHVRVLPEAASIVYGGGFPRTDDTLIRRASQRAIFHVQRELEATGEVGSPCAVLCDRGTVDGGAFWPGPGELWFEVGTTLEDERRRYGAVIQLRTPKPGSGYQQARLGGLASTGRAGLGSYDQHNPLRIETPYEAHVIDERIAHLWRGHPRVFTVDATPDFIGKASRALEILRGEIPECCRPRALVLA